MENRNFEQEQRLQAQADRIVSEQENMQSQASQNTRDEALFLALEKRKKKKRRKRILTILLIVVLFAVSLGIGVKYLRGRVNARLADTVGTPVAYEASRGSISTSVSGSGTLSNVDEETITIPSGVKIEQVLVSENDSVRRGDPIAILDLVSVRSTMANVQSELEALDRRITEMSNDAARTYVSSGIRGRLKKIYASVGDNVLAVMYEHGALALVSLDGYMAVEIPAGELRLGDTVTVLRGDEKQTPVSGFVDTITTGMAVVLLSDNGPELDELVTVLADDGKIIGSGKLEIHRPLRITGVSGKVRSIVQAENNNLFEGTILFYLSDVSFHAGYEALLEERKEKEEDLLNLMRLDKNGALLAEIGGSVVSVDYDEEKEKTTAAKSSALLTSSSGDSTSDTRVVTISPDQGMKLTISVDESNILSLKTGQSASITVSSIGEETFSGVVTEISRKATSSGGVTRYSAEITMDKDARMLSGMSAKAVVRIQGVDDAILIPAAALNQTSSVSFVYTSYDSESGQLGGIVEVESGISNGNYVEIIKGLHEGDTVYYKESARRSAFGGRSNSRR